MSMGGGWVLDVDIRKYFDNMDHGHIRTFIRQRVNDGVILRLIDKWLKAGVMEKGVLSFPKKGSPQGGVVSPLLSNIYLHDVIDLGVELAVKPRLAGSVELVRFADDILLIFRNIFLHSVRIKTGAFLYVILAAFIGVISWQIFLIQTVIA